MQTETDRTAALMKASEGIEIDSADGRAARVMAGPFPWTPSNLPDGHYIFGVCRTCRDVRYVTRAMMLERVGDVPFRRIEGRLRCIARPNDKRGPACGGPMTLELGASRTVRVANRTAQG